MPKHNMDAMTGGIKKRNAYLANGNLYSTSTVRDSTLHKGNKTFTSDPDWRLKIARQQSATHDYTALMYSMNMTDPLWTGSSKCISGSYKNWKADIAHQPNLPFTSLYLGDTTKADEIASSKFRSKVRNALSYKNVVVPVAELKDLRGTLAAVADVTKGTLAELIRIKRGRGSARNIRNLAAQAWLGFGFGVSPMISDANEIVNSIGARLKDGASIRIAAGHTTDNNAGLVTTISGTNFTDIECTLVGKRYCRVSYIGGYHTGTIDSANSYSISEQFGLNFGSLPLVAWELIPYSWVVDYFTNMGNFLEDTFVSLPTPIYFCKTVKQQFEGRWTGRHVPLGKNYSVYQVLSSNCPPAHRRVFSISRSSQGTLQAPRLRFKSVDEITHNAFNKVLNLASVLVQGRK